MTPSDSNDVEEGWLLGLRSIAGETSTKSRAQSKAKNLINSFNVSGTYVFYSSSISVQLITISSVKDAKKTEIVQAFWLAQEATAKEVLVIDCCIDGPVWLFLILYLYIYIVPSDPEGRS